MTSDELDLGGSGYAQLRYGQAGGGSHWGSLCPAKLLANVRTIGGGQILHPTPNKRESEWLLTPWSRWPSLEKGESGEMVELYLKRWQDFAGVGERDLRILANVTAKAAASFAPGV